MFGLIFQREVYGLFKIFFLLRVAKKAVLKKEESQKCHLAFKNEEKDGLSWHYLCQLHILQQVHIKDGAAARSLGSLWTPHFLLSVMSIRTHGFCFLTISQLSLCWTISTH